MGGERIGPIVWVRRRNGSWWPGKIMEGEEIPHSNLTSPRTGTPVKLLGRQDASVDWYNLEKSKRVKAFRCGEFDDCIEKAESAQGMPIKKREKYARREDAILHALELEKEFLGKQGKSGLSSDQQLGSEASFEEKLGITSGGLENDIGHGNAKCNHNIPERENVDVETTVPGNATHMFEAKDGDQLVLEDDRCVETSRTKGLRDFGLRAAPLKRKLSPSVDSDDSAQLLEENQSQGPINVSSIERTNERTNLANEEDGLFSICRAKRSKSVYLSAESSASVDGKGYPLNQDKLPQFEDDDYHNLPECLNQENSTSEFTGDVASDSSESGSDCSESESDSSETEPDFDEEMAAFPEQGVLRRKRREELESSSSEDLDDPYFVNEAVSKWQLKRRRNTRFLTNTLADGVGDRNFDEPLRGNFYRTRARSLGQRAYGFEYDDGDDDDYDDESLERNYIGTQMMGLNYASRFASKNPNSYSGAMMDWDNRNFEGQPFRRRRWDYRREYFNPRHGGRHYFGGSPRSMLIDVDLKVRASYPKQRAPIISLTSKLDGKAIIGHPIQIEVLEDGSTEPLVSTINDFEVEVIGHDRNTAIAPAWRTARRTSFRVPRPNLPSILGVDDSDKDLSAMEQEQAPFKQINAGSWNPKGNLIRTGLPHVSRPLPDMKPPGKLPKKVNLSSSPKTRMLSSIGLQQNFGNKARLGIFNNQRDGLRKPETSGLTTVACIPVKLVFSRLLEKINRPPSKGSQKSVVPRRDGEEEG